MNPRDLHNALAGFKAAALKLARELETADVHELAGYPAYLPSFDEFAHDLIDVELFDADVNFDVRPSNVRIPGDDAELFDAFGADTSAEASPLGEVDDARFWGAVNVVSGYIGPERTLTLARDWEGCVFGVVDGPDPDLDVLAFTTDGRVGYGGVNMPNYMPAEDYVAQVARDRGRS